MALTIIIPFLNEGEEVERTICSIKDTTITDCEILLINDTSDDGFDYKFIADKYGCNYVEHTQRKGSAGSKNEGVQLCKTEYFLLLDAHMRFYEKGWDARLLEILQKHPRAILCSQTKFLQKLKNGKIIDKIKKISYAGYIDFEYKEHLRVVWNKVDTEPFSNIMEIPCVIGAAYACNKEYWNRIRGMDGLITYGTEEELISMKAWMEGGQCLLIKDWVVGHIYRKKFPYEMFHQHTIYNRLYTAELLLPYNVKNQIFRYFKQTTGDVFNKAYHLLHENYPQIKPHKLYIKSISNAGIERFLSKNQQIMELNAQNT